MARGMNRRLVAGRTLWDLPPYGKTGKLACVLRHRGVGSPPTGGVYVVGRSKREVEASKRRRTCLAAGPL